MDERLLSALDRTAKRVGRDRSKLVREAVERFLAEATDKDKEQAVIEAYTRQPLTRDERDWLEAGEGSAE
jgi:metal-responsive CopG/Arc/MetJ family transcriptional regulator